MMAGRPLIFLIPWILTSLTMVKVGHSQSDPCGPQNICENGGVCITSETPNRCQCAPGYTGNQCETDIDWCVTPRPHDCRNNAPCVDGLLSFSCACLAGWEGDLCEQEKDECQPNPCRNGGVCTDKFDSFSCTCPVEFSGEICQNDVDECAENSTICGNNGTCQNSVGGFTCDCVPGFTGTLCDTEIDECATNPCFYDGKCVDLINNFRCECQPSFVGPLCQGVVNQCIVDNPCQAGGACVNKPGGGYTCLCPPGYYGPHCELEVNVCASRPCRNGATCTNLNEGYSCRCTRGYIGTDCETDINECDAKPCENGGSCNETTPGSYTCNCLAGYEGPDCEVDVDECQNNTCKGQQVCVDLVNEFRCVCPVGKTGTLCDTELIDCTTIPCENGGVCSNPTSANTSFPTFIESVNANISQCACPSPFVGQTCSESTDVCVPQPCQHGGTCIREADGNGTVVAKCACVQGYIGERCDNLAEDCRGTQQCRNGGMCVQKSTDLALEDRFECECPGNYTGTLCEIEPSGCLPNPCRNNATCTALGPVDFQCDCLTGWTGLQCEQDVDECSPDIQPSVCRNQAACVNLVPGYRCVCSRYWTGPTCETDVLECAQNMTLTCKNNGTCLEMTGGPPSCKCAEGYTGSDCSIDLGQCDPNPCWHNGTCAVNGSSTISCQCVLGFTGKLCEKNIDECTILQPCHNNATCVDGTNNFTCLCTSGWEGATCDSATDYCANQPCQNGGTCQNITEGDGFLCRCAPGYAGQTCEREVNECGFNPCRNNATCVDLVNAFRCECLPGYTGVACNVDINECASNPCSSQATCVEGVNTYTCICPAGFEGPGCNVDIDECASRPCRHGGKCSQGQPSTFNCSCPSGVIGEFCEIVSTATFNGASALTFNLSPSQQSSIRSRTDIRRRRAAERDGVQVRRLLYTTSDLRDSPLARYKRQTVALPINGEDNAVLSQVQFTMATTVLDGILLVLTGVTDNGSPQHIYLGMAGDDLHLSANDGSRLLTDQVTISGPSTSGIINHVVQLNLAAGQIELKLNPSSCGGSSNVFEDADIQCVIMKLDFTQDAHNGSVSEWNLAGQFHFGGVSEFSSYTRSIVMDTNGFIGCLGNLQLNGMSVNLADAEELSLAQTNASVKAPGAGCPSHFPCLETSCANGGTCQDLWLYKVCTCALGFSGEMCEFQNMANFEPEDMLHFAGNPALSSIVFDISSANGTGLVLYTLTTDSLSLSLDNGQIRLQLILSDTGRDIVTRVGQDLHRQGWFKVAVDFDGDQYKLDVTSQEMASLGSVSGTAGSPILVTGPLYLGALHAHPALDKWRNLDVALPSQLSFKGCIRDVVIDSQRLDLSTRVATSLGNDPPIARPGCQKEEACLDNPCDNFGRCVAGWERTTCKCMEGFGGDNCTEALAFTFDGTSSYSLITLDRSVVPFGDTGAVKFRTRQSAATILLFQFTQLNGTSGLFIEFRIFAGRLQIYSSLTAETESSDAQVSDGQWHTLNWTRSELQLDIQLDGQELFLSSGLNPVSSSLGNVVYVFVGARPLYPGRDNQIVGFFKGCVRGLSFNSDDIPFAVATANTSDINAVPFNNMSANLQQLSFSSLIVEPVNLSSGCHGDVICRINPCPSNAFCVDNWNMASCPCLLGWEGAHCNISVDDCTTNLCQNGAVCIDGHVSYTCICSSDRFTGRYCDSLTNPCLNGPPCNSSTTASCVAMNDTSVDCICQSGYTGVSCDDLVDNCSPSPCLHNGSCLNALNRFQCECPDGYSGPVCEDRDPCIPDPCNNGGTCLRRTNLLNTSYIADTSNTSQPFSSSLSTPSSVNTLRTNNLSPSSSPSIDSADSFICDCPQPYYGSLCQSYNFCEGNLCRNNASCLIGENRYTCQCLPGFYGTFCEFEDHCASLPCQHDAECRNEVETYICLCPFYFTGKSCETAINQCQFNVCFNGATCIFNESAVWAAYNSKSSSSMQASLQAASIQSPSAFSSKSQSSTALDQLADLGKAAETALSPDFSALTSKSPANSTAMFINSTYCICAQGFFGDNCQFDLNECDSNPCRNNGTCRDSTSRHMGENFFVGYRCTCHSGFFGHACEFEEDECNNSSVSSSSNQNSTICINGGVCEDLVNDFRCRCLPGFNGRRCEIDVRGCASAPCQNEARCQGDVNDPSSYTCLCEAGFTGSLCEVNNDDCVDNRCENNAICRDGINSYSCDCLSGYSGERCETVVDACYSQPCYNGGLCLYQGLCSCPDVVETCGWQDEVCQLATCDQKPDCQTLSVSYLCNCTGTGYTLPQCAQDEDECELSPCLHGGVCTNSVGSYSCNCLATGYHGHSCHIDDDECQNDQACFNGGTCENVPGSYRCDCPPEWEGLRCGQNRDDCRPENPCQNGGRCQDKLGDYQCDCTGTGFEGKNCTENVDDCANNRCEHNGTCVDGVRQYTCLCEGTGYTGQFCQVQLVPLACSPSPCLHDGQCGVNTDGTVSCNCTGTGFTGLRCQEDIDECQDGSHLCQGGSSCLNIVGSYSCDCSPSTTGVFCETDVTGGNQGKSTSSSSSSSDLSSGAIVGVVLAFIVVIVLILAVLAFAILRRRRTSGRYKPSEAEYAANGGAGFDRRGNGVVGVNGTAGGIEMVDTTGERMI